MLNPDRVREVCWLLRKMINVDKKYQWNHIPIADILPFLEKDLSKAIIDGDERSESILEWLAHAIFYMKQDTDDLPRIELNWNLT